VAIYIGGPDRLDWEGARAKVRGDLWRPGNSLPDDVVDRALHASVLDIEGECKWLWLEELTAIVTLDEESEFIDLPPTVGRVSSVGIRRDAFLDELDEVTLSVIRQNISTDVGDPARWAMTNGRIAIDSRAQAGTVFELIVSSQTPEVLEDALASPAVTLGLQQQAVIANACSHVALGFMKNADEAARQRAIYDRIVERLHNVEAEKRGGMIQPDTWGMGHNG
jgi:hypothetical protein